MPPPPHPFRLRRLHNPECIDTAAIPPGFRLLYEDEVDQVYPEAIWFRPSPREFPHRWWPSNYGRLGRYQYPPRPHMTYITAVNPRRDGLVLDDFSHYAPSFPSKTPRP